MLKRILPALYLACFSSAAIADVFVSIEHAVTPASLKSVAVAIERVGNRPAEQQGYPLYFSIQDDVTLNCPAHKPDEAGNGCFLFVSPSGRAKLGDVNVSLRKPVDKALLMLKANEAAQKISDVDPNSTEEHLHFGNPLYTNENGAIDGTHYFCAPEGEANKMEWTCFLHVSEMLSPK